MGSLSGSEGEKLKKVQKLKRHLVTTLALPKREFGEAIRAIRDELGITPLTRLPSPTFVNQLGDVDLGGYPRGIPRRGYLARRYPATIAEYDASDPKHLEMLYRELSRIYHSYIPEEYRDEHITGWGWSNFLVACVFYDPPETRLLEFAAYDDPPYDPAPVRSLPEVVEEMIYAERRMWIETIGEIERHYLESSKDEGSSLVAKVWDQNPHLEKQRLQTWEKVLDRYYIEVNEDTTEDDVRRAFRMIAASRKEQHEKRSKGGRPPRDPLIALQAAILYDDHNPRDSKDGRRRQWTFERLAEELPGVFSGSAAKKHVIEGREYRQGKALPEV